MARSNKNRGINIESALQQIMDAVVEDDEEIYREGENSDSDFSDDDDQTYAPSSLGSEYSDNENIRTESLTDSESESEEEEKEDSFNASLTTSAYPSSISDSSSILPDTSARTGKEGTVWSSLSSPQGRIRSHNVINTRLHRVHNSDIYTPKDAFRIFFSDNLVQELLLCTNLQGRRVAKKWHAVQEEELLAFIGVLLLAGAEKNWDVDTRQLFLDQKSNPTYKASFGINRFENIRRNLRFDDKRTRVERLKVDKLAAFSYIWGLFIENCKTQFSLGAYTTVDEQLVPFRGRCPFTQYMPSKPAKYGIKIFWLCDASFPYACNARIYVGRQPGSEPERHLGQNVVTQLTSPLQGSGRNVTMDNYFTGVPLAKSMLQNKLTIVGTMKKCKREVPECMKASKFRETKTSVFGFNDQLTMISYVPKKNKAVILLSTMHHDISIDEEDPKKLPEIIKFYNKTKIGVDLVDQMVGTYTCRRQTRRWPLKLFFNLLDIAALNAYTVFKQVYPDQQGTERSRRRFITDLAESLILPHMKTRQKIPQLQKATKEAMVRCGLSFPSIPPPESMLQKRKRCSLCPSTKDRKVAKCCSRCCRPVCPEHSIINITCTECYE